VLKTVMFSWAMNRYEKVSADNCSCCQTARQSALTRLIAVKCHFCMMLQGFN